MPTANTTTTAAGEPAATTQEERAQTSHNESYDDRQFQLKRTTSRFKPRFSPKTAIKSNPKEKVNDR